MNTSNKDPWYSYIFGFFAFWLLVFLGWTIPLLINLLTPPAFRYEVGSLGYLVLYFFAMPIGAYLAQEALRSILIFSYRFVLFTLVLASVVFILLVAFNILTIDLYSGPLWEVIYMIARLVVTASVFIWAVVDTVKDAHS